METRDFKRLKVLDKLQWFFDRMGVNYSVIRKILQVKMIMDERRVPTIFNQNKKKDGTVKKESNWIHQIVMGVLIDEFIFAAVYFFRRELFISNEFDFWDHHVYGDDDDGIGFFNGAFGYSR